jgi:signal peptidase complex subunit 2
MLVLGKAARYIHTLSLTHHLQLHPTKTDNKTKQITISTRADKFDPTYKLKVKYNPTALATIPPVEKEISAPFMQWFTSDGFFVAAPFQQWLALNIDMVGDADPKTIQALSGHADDEGAGLVSALSVEQEAMRDLLDVVKSGPPPAAAAAAAAPPAAKSRKRV